MIAERSRGIPRLINNICFNALSQGCARREKQIDSDVVKEAAKDLSIDIRVPQPGAAQGQSVTRPARGPKLLVESAYQWIKDSLVRRRLFQTSAIMLLFCGMAIYVGARSGSATLRQQATSQSKSESTATVARVQNPSAQAISQNNTIKRATESYVYVVQPQDTLRDLCLSTLGRYDNSVLSEIRDLNPGLKNPEHLHAGQEIRLPMSSTK